MEWTFFEERGMRSTASMSTKFRFPFDSKRWIADDGVHTNAYEYINMPIWPPLTDHKLRELDAEVLEWLGGNSVWRHNQQFFTLHAVIQYRFIWFDNKHFNSVNFQRLDWICGSFLHRIFCPVWAQCCRHDGGELRVVHHIAAGVRDEVLFHHFFCYPADAGG